MSDPSIVGTIASCPRCHSMVEIQRPTQQVAVGASDIDSQAITEDSIAPPSQSDSPAGEELPSGFDDADQVDSDSADAETPLGPAWQSERTQRSRQIALVVACSVTGLLAAVLLFGWFVKNWRDQSGVTAQASSGADPADDSDPTSPAETVGDAATAVDDAAVDGDAGDHDDQQQTVPANADGPENDRAGEQVDQPTDDSQSTSDRPGDDSRPAEDLPVGLVPPSLLDTPATDSDDSLGEDADEPWLELPPGLAQYGVFLEADGPVDMRPTREAPPTLDELDINVAAEENVDAMMVATPVKKIDAKSDLAIPLAIDSKPYRLTDLCLLISQLTGVPIQIDWVSFDLTGVDVCQPIEAPKTRLISAQELLDTIAAAIGAEVRIEESLIELTPSDAVFDAQLAQLTDLADFGGGRESAASLLNEFLQAGEGQAADQLQIGPTRQDRQFAILAVESLRRMRGIDPQLPDALLGHWAQASEAHTVEWPPLVGGQAGVQRHTPVSVAGLIRGLSRLNDTGTVVHWRDATRRHLSPTDVLLPHTEQDAATMLKRLLSEYELQARRVDDQRWWIGSPATYDRAKVVVWSKPLGDQADSLTDRIRSVMAARDSFRVAVDPDSDRAIMMLPRYIVRQLPKIQESLAAN